MRFQNGEEFIFPNSSHAQYDRPTDLEAGLSYMHPPSFDRYLRIHKHLVGPASAGLLINIALDLAEQDSPSYRFAAGSAAAEAALVSNERRNVRLGYLDDAEKYWEDAIRERNTRDSVLDPELDVTSAAVYRMLTSHTYLPLMREMVRGYITEETLDDTYDALLKLASQLIFDIDTLNRSQHHDMASPYVGLVHEVIDLLSLNNFRRPWQIAMPSLYRADHGLHYPEQTHDLQMLDIQWGKIKNVTTIESKASSVVGMNGRYQAVVISGGNHLGIKNPGLPAQTIYFFLKQREGTITEDELLYLERTIFTAHHLAQHQSLKLPNVSSHCPDIYQCNEIPGWQDYIGFWRQQLWASRRSNRRSRQWALNNGQFEVRLPA
jgi:hypothetical protein